MSVTTRGWLVLVATAAALAAQPAPPAPNSGDEAKLRAMVRADPGNAEARQNLGRLLAVAGKRGEALDQLAAVVRLRPDSAAAYNTLGMALSRFMETRDARAAFEKALQLDPRLAQAHVNLALILAQEKEFPLAGEHLDRAIELQGKSQAAARSHYLRAQVFGELGDMESSAKELESAVALRQGDAEAWLALGMARRSLMDDAQAFAALKRAVALDPRNAKARYQLGMRSLDAGDARAAVVQLREARHLGLEDRATLYALQRALRMDKKDGEARQVAVENARRLRESDAAMPNAFSAVGLNNEGVELEKTGNVAEAGEKYRKALELDPHHGGFRINYGLALCRLRSWDRGIAELREVLRADPNNADAARALYIAIEQSSRANAATSPAR